MAEDHDSMFNTPAFRAIKFAEGLLADMSGGKVVDPRGEGRRQFDAMFSLMKSTLIELERIGDILEYSSKGKLDRDGI